MTSPFIPYGKITSSEQLGQVIRAKRKADGLTQAEAAALCGVGVRLLGEVERGKSGAEMGKVQMILRGIGLELSVTPRTATRP